MSSNLRGFSGFREMLTARQKAVNSLACMGLDPLVEKVPNCLRNPNGSVSQVSMVDWLVTMASESSDYVSMYKPQKAHYEALYADGIDGSWVLRQVVSALKSNFPDIPVFLDCKRGDIGRTQERYRIAHLSVDNVDGMNFSPYMGKDCMEYLVSKEHPGRAIVGLCYTSNKSARETQDVRLANGQAYWEFMARTIHKWAKELGVVADAGLVMAAAHKDPRDSKKIFSFHLSHVRKIVGNEL
jgi:orotidine-5'-phosphate decarboxylase